MITIRFILLCVCNKLWIVMDTTRLPESEVLVFRILVWEKLQWSEVNLMIFHSKVSSKLWKIIKNDQMKKNHTTYSICVQCNTFSQFRFRVPKYISNYILRDDLFYVTDLFIQSRINVLLVSLLFHESIVSINHTKLKCKSCIKCDT